MAFYTRTIELEGVAYKQIGPTQWQNLKTGQIIDNTKLVVLVNEFKQRRAVSALVGGTAGACCEIVDGVMECSSKTQDACSEGCFKGEGTNCGESPTPCSTCVHCCFVGAECVARTPSACLLAGGTYFAFDQGCTACKFGVCSSDATVTERFYGNGCTGTFIVGGKPNSFDVGVFCTGSGIGQTCGSTGFRYQQLTPNFIQGATCSACILGACCTGGSCLGGTLTSQAACSVVGGLFYPGQTCGRCDFGVYCTGDGVSRTCLGTGYRGEALTNQFQQGATCSYCTMGTCCVNGDATVGVRQTNCAGTFFPGIFTLDACDTGSCCLGATCNENVFRYNCAGVFNSGLTCIACSSGACCLSSGGCTLTTMGACMATGGTFFGGATCSACDTGSCCNVGECTDQRRGNFCQGTFFQGSQCSESPCELGACCVGSTCIPNTPSITCSSLGGVFFGGATCIACQIGANCDVDEEGNPVCYEPVYFGSVLFGGFYQGQTCSACDEGACCNQLGGGQTGIRGDCTGSSTFYAGQTLFVCDAGVYCTGSGVGQTCFGLGHRGQSLTNNFIVGATCSSCILGSCCTGGTCLGGGLTSQAACSSAGGLFFAGRTCTVCDFGVYCTGATCLSLGYRGQSLSNNFILGATCSSCIQGACCTGGTCLGGGQTSQAACSSVSGLFYPGATCRSCDFGVYCTGATCFGLGYRAQALTNNFIQGATCNSCILGACCTGGTCLGGGQTSQAACSVAGGTFYVGATCTQCVTGVFCTGSGVGQTCFGLGHRGQSLTNNFIAGATCSSCILGACCTGGSCLGGGLTSQAACSAVGGLFYAGTTCVSCDYGVYCTGSNETTSCLGLGYRAQNLSNQFVISGSCALDCVYGSCCQGTTCLGITNQANCPKPNTFFAGMTCGACDTGTGACCTGGSSSITTITGCNALGGIFFPEGTTALCITGSCCTGGTCITEIAGRSGNCQLFIAGATCGICDTGVYCTGATCLQLGFRGQSLTSNFIAGATCNSCILGICCTGGTCISGGQTAQINCPSSVGSFVAGATQCSACAINVNCCVGGTHSYILAEQCAALGGIVFEGAEDSLVCQSGAFCTGRTCAGVTLLGFNLTEIFVVDGDCGDCIYGTCCNQDYEASDTTQNNCVDTFYPGDFNSEICTQGLTFGICCENEICNEDVEQSECTGYFLSSEQAIQNSISCGSNACELGVCCDEDPNVTSVTGGVCLGTMTRAECAMTGGDFFPFSQGATCSNCLYTPMLASVVLRNFRQDITGTFKTYTFGGNITGHTGNEIQPRKETNVAPNTWISSRSDAVDSRFYAYSTFFAITGPVQFYGSGQDIVLRYNNIGSGYTAWYNNKIIDANFSVATGDWQGRTGNYDYSPVFELGITRTNGGFSFGFIRGNTLEVPRYVRFVFGYSNPQDDFADTVLVYRFSHNIVSSGDISQKAYSRKDATNHALLGVNDYNLFPAVTPFSDANGSNNYSSPVLLQLFAENPLARRIRPVGSCCVGATCIGIVTQDHCQARGGTFNVNGRCSRCYPEFVFGNCCVGGTNAGFTSLAKCNNLSGTFFEGTTFDSESCITGVICTEDRQCFQGVSFSYYGAFSPVNNKFFIEQPFGSTLGCLSCDSGICCVGSTCMGRIPKTDCDALGGSLYYNETECQTNCDLGICCPISGGCGTYTNRANCYGINDVFVNGATPGASCSACSSLLRLTSYTPGVTYTMVLNEGTTHGTFYDGSPWVQQKENLKLLKVVMTYVGMTGDRTLTFAANTKVSGLTLTPSGYKGSVYVHGCVKNPKSVYYIDPVLGETRGKYAFHSLTFAEYDEGWKGPKTIGATENPANYTEFDLNYFLDIQNQFKYYGVTMTGGDVFMTNATNFDNERAPTFPSNSSGVPYQLYTRRTGVLTYGILNCLSATGAALAGSTQCFRPPNSWPEEDRVNKPIYPISNIEGKIPGQPGHTLIQLTSSIVDGDLEYNSEVASSCAQASEFGDGVDYNRTSPGWAMGGKRNTLSSYGEQFIVPIQSLIQAVYATGSAKTRWTHEQRKDAIIRITQYGLDSWGAQRIFAICMAAGAGQKAGRTRGWIPLAGYYLGATAMYDPEMTMLSDTARMEKWISSVYEPILTTSAEGTCVTRGDWRKFVTGDTGPENNFKGLRKSLARSHSHDALTMYEFNNDPNNLVLYHDYVGKAYKITVISGFGTTGATGITFYNEYRKQIVDIASQRVEFEGNFGVIRWGFTGTTANPLERNYFNYSNKAGSDSSFNGMWLRVESGPGSSGPGGATASRFYRILWTNGFRSDSDPAPNKYGGGWQILIGQTWADGIPNETSTLKFYPFIQADMGLTRPSSFDSSGYTSGSIAGFVRVANPSTNGCGALPQNQANSTMWDANASGETPYFPNSLDAWAPQFLLADYLMRTKGVTLVSDAVPIPDYIRQYVYTSPFNVFGLFPWYTGTTTVFNTWLGATWANASFMKSNVNFAQHYPGTVKYRGLTV